MGTAQLCLVGLVMLFGIVGVLVPGLPGVLLCWAAVLWWALAERTSLAWFVLVGATAVLLVNQVLKWLLPSRSMREAGVPWRTLAVGGVAGVVGFFLIPLIGLAIGFVLGVYAMEWLRLGGHSHAWVSTRTALRAIGFGVLIELFAALLVAGAWSGAVLFG
ncbi:DUF456 domain-containing protein [Wenjunlia tyrosinilytica]|uniref:Membrane protein n=1 Tax=Wenjunlia tyrosinilytica TaxID=1544741 RepID=A0A917ZUG0_9ACTN|nr:DUF456 domain-containing protein [Wenjunlia tyrosinilytica]GGO92333.1 membrane protein [Wenjunlia tyrosinilytica]